MCYSSPDSDRSHMDRRARWPLGRRRRARARVVRLHAVALSLAAGPGHGRR